MRPPQRGFVQVGIWEVFTAGGDRLTDSKPAIDCGISAPGLKDDGRPVNNLVRRTVKVRDL
jgi:hypothetical protein